ncbi:hypothetical protein IW261DRAFT_293013 [Armillaria novae-zelandiae]|uniref:Uncharacterized protein n=1 Tax=Armillaria novae-zelandiae TaxID=153914 RepID=A0AA39KG13_9AGAR|nr:hypothetical protein IW261DRAFT_293013 [Armillaria novae-zelandiae]
MFQVSSQVSDVRMPVYCCTKEAVSMKKRGLTALIPWTTNEHSVNRERATRHYHARYSSVLDVCSFSFFSLIPCVPAWLPFAYKSRGDFDSIVPSHPIPFYLLYSFLPYFFTTSSRRCSFGASFVLHVLSLTL